MKKKSLFTFSGHLFSLQFMQNTLWLHDFPNVLYPSTKQVSDTYYSEFTLCQIYTMNLRQVYMAVPNTLINNERLKVLKT